jgi:hypothetical protein
MGIRKIVLLLTFSTIILFSSRVFGEEPSPKADKQILECNKLSGSIFAMMLISGVPPDVAGQISMTKLEECRKDKDLKETIRFVQMLSHEYLRWRRMTFDCAFLIGKMSEKSQAINNQIIKDYELQKIGDCVEMMMKEEKR